MDFKNLIYFNMINSIGGVESWLYYISKLYNKHDITVVYRNGNERQIRRLEENVRVLHWDGKTRLECDTLFLNYATDIMDYVDCKRIVYWVHSDYSIAAKLNMIDPQAVRATVFNPRITDVIAASKSVQKSLKELTGYEAKVCYNPVWLSEPKRILRLCSAQRMTIEKGRNRIQRLAKALEKYCAMTGNRFEWDIYTTDYKTINVPGVEYKQPDLKINSFFGNYDYFVALSDCEAYCYSVVEALCRGTPCVVTPIPVFEEIGLNDSNSIRLEFDCSNADNVAEQMFSRSFSFEYQPMKSDFEELLAEGDSGYENNRVTVRVIEAYRDLMFNRTKTPGETFTVTRDRAKTLIESGYVVKED